MIHLPTPGRAALITLPLLLGTAAAQATIRVPSQQPTITAALAAAAPGDTIVVAPGLYLENDLDPGGKELTIRGERGAASTVLDFRGAGGFLVENDEGPGLVFDGLTLRRGARTTQQGGALRITGRGAPTVRNCVFAACPDGAIWMQDDTGITVTGTRFERIGGRAVESIGPGSTRVFLDCAFVENETGLWIQATSPLAEATLERCSFSRHSDFAVGIFDHRTILRDCIITANNGTDAMRCGTDDPGHSILFERCTISNNRSATTMLVSGSSPLTMRDTEFVNNHSATRGGGLSLFGQPATLENCSFVGNTCTGFAGALWIAGATPSGPPVWSLRRCRFVDNFCTAGVGALRVTSSGGTIEDCLFLDNLSTSDHGAMDAGIVSTLRNCTIVGNHSIAPAAGNEAAVSHQGNLDVRSCILWDNAPAQLDASMTLLVEYTNVQGGFVGTGNIDTDPMFVLGNGDYRLAGTSPCLDAGQPGAVSPGRLDLDGDPRLLGSAVDMGCDEGAVQPLPGTGEDLELHTWIDGSGPPTAPSKTAPVGSRLSVLARSPQSSFLGAVTLIIGDLTMTGAPAPTSVGWPGLHVDLQSPSLFIAVNTFGFGGPLGIGGLSEQGLAFDVTVPPGLSGLSLYLQAVALDARAANANYAASNAHEIQLQ